MEHKNTSFLKVALLLSFFLTVSVVTKAIEKDPYVTFVKEQKSFAIAENGKVTAVLIDKNDFPGVIRAAKSWQSDIGKVVGIEPLLLQEMGSNAKQLIIIGTLGHSSIIDQLVKDKKLNVNALQGKWEMFQTQIIAHPMAGVESALVIVGSDKRGSIFGLYDLSAQMGVSPLYWWADVPVKKHSSIYVKAGIHTKGEPKVKYRGIFINDEAPALSGWTKEKFGGFNHQLYEKVFELILRMKGNYLWPAMWGNAFQVDDKLNPVLADEYGIVIGTSHHEPLMRAHDEWRRFGKGAWDYSTNDSTLREFWRESMKERWQRENIVAVGMRGDGDKPMSEGTATALLEKIVADQRKILHEVTGKDPAEIPQSWALYKEVQDYYDKGMRVPDDITLLLCDDNWGNIRKLPTLGSATRKGGYGIYYHFDYVGDPRNYKWLNTNPLPRVWEQMHLAYEYGVRQIWIVNVGDIKPMEFPIEFFLDYAWNPDNWSADQVENYSERWASANFGEKYATDIAYFLNQYTKFNARRKPELLAPETYSLVNYQEAEKVVKEYNNLLKKAEAISEKLDASYQDAYYQLVLFPIKACANLNELYFVTAQNRLYAKQGRAITNNLAEKVAELFQKDAELTIYYNKTLANGKWNHFADQTHIGYTYWQQPPNNSMPKVDTIKVHPIAEMGVAIEGSEKWWTTGTQTDTLKISQENKGYFEVFNQGSTAFPVKIKADNDWLSVAEKEGTINQQQRFWVNIDWTKVKNASQTGTFTLIGANMQKVIVKVEANKMVTPSVPNFKGFIESDGYISMEAEHFSRAVGKGNIQWKVIPDIGKTSGGVTTFPVNSLPQTLEKDSPHLEYDLYLSKGGEVSIQIMLSPTLEFNESKGLKFAISFDEEQPQVVDMHANRSKKAWEESVANNIKMLTSKHFIKNSGKHTLKFWMIDAGVVVQKIVIDAGGVKESYLGPPESRLMK